MSRLVVDASVVVKWLLPQREDEADIEQALGLLEGVRTGRVRVYQPVHWLAETAAVLVRLSPATASADVADLYAIDLPVESGPEVYHLACELARAEPPCIRCAVPRGSDRRIRY